VSPTGVAIDHRLTLNPPNRQRRIVIIMRWALRQRLAWSRLANLFAIVAEMIKNSVMRGDSPTL
jgi:hypothetical protein